MLRTVAFCFTALILNEASLPMTISETDSQVYSESTMKYQTNKINMQEMSREDLFGKHA